MNISILGCGWLGLPLAQHLIKKGNVVKGSTTTYEKLSILKDNGIMPFLINLSVPGSDADLKDFLDTELLIINIPPGIRRNNGEEHLLQIRGLLDGVKNSSLSKIIFVSSTSVYPDSNGLVYEDDIQDESHSGNSILYRAEEMVRHSGLDYFILRCGGLTGYDRILVKYFAGRKDLPMGHCPVNLIHRDDLVNIVSEFVIQDNWNEVYNICAPLHPLRKDFYKNLADKMGMEPPVYNDSDNSSFKIISPDKLIKDLKYSYLYPDPMLFAYTPG